MVAKLVEKKGNGQAPALDAGDHLPAGERQHPGRRPIKRGEERQRDALEEPGHHSRGVCGGTTST